ncbi:hypothetical protein BWQ96_02206 [Gracilariopsis chorda]|uniref:Uncharacterized protein n=1 Tax=Gracilariopsis chorda TaxID=448386 RepID=A0A2V3J115_9FLOR|nr:hypothetical protein BWQ96_02206 [Gracilariopsis chorda]|eukprot:PXF48015.1 hypothetical protein BWQ96_02206 [Gracilariopsis chorda]
MVQLQIFLQNSQQHLEVLSSNATTKDLSCIKFRKQSLGNIEKALTWRMFTLKRRREKYENEVANRQSSRNTAVKIGYEGYIGHEKESRSITQNGNVDPMDRETVESNVSGIKRVRECECETLRSRASLNCFNCFKSSPEEKAMKARRSSAKPILRQFIPGLPKTIEDAIKLWMYGDGLKTIALHLFDKAGSRKKLVQGYTNAWWKQSGQKAAYYKYKKLVKLVCDEVEGLTIFDDDDKKWETATSLFHDKRDQNGIPRPLSVFLVAQKK